MKIAYLIECHKNSNQVNRLIDRLNNKDVVFFVHVDKKSDIKIQSKSNLFLIKDKDRISVEWGNLSQINAEKMLMKYALESNVLFDYAILLSGQDYPIKSNEDIFKFLEDNKGYDFVNCIANNDVNSKEYKRFSKRMAIKYPSWMMKDKLYAKILRNLYIYITGGYYHTYIFKKKHYSYENFYFGSNWFALRRDTLAFVYTELCRENWIMKDLEYSDCPDEAVVQTILVNNGYINQLKDKLTYVDFTNQSRSPWTLDEKWYNELKDSNFLFARKFEEGYSDKILEMIDETLL